MSREKFVIADTHFSQPSMCAFGSKEGPLRPWGRYVDNWKDLSPEEKSDLMPEFERRAQEMDEAIIERWNAVVPTTGATVYHLGDVTMKEKYLPILNRLNGKKKLILGNHDIFSAKTYLQYFYDVTALRVGDGIIMSHIPIHEDSIKDRWIANVHGHLHAGTVNKLNTYEAVGHDGQDETILEINPRYLCVSVEQTNFSPLPWDDMLKKIERQRKEYP